MNPLIELVVYVVVGAGLLVLNHLVLGDMGELKTISLMILGAAAGFLRGSYVPPVSTQEKK
jgi:hypothetical protein